MKVFVHPSNEYPDIFSFASTPIVIEVGYESEIVLGAQMTETTVDFEKLEYSKRGCILKSEAHGLPGYFSKKE